MSQGKPNIPDTQAECVELSRQVLACLDKLATATPSHQEADALKLAACQLQLVIDLLDHPDAPQS